MASTHQLPTPQYSREIPNTARPNNRGPIHRCAITNTNTNNNTLDDASPKIAAFGCYTLYEVLRHGCELNPRGPCMGYRSIASNGLPTPYVYASYLEIVSRVDALAMGMHVLELLDKNEDGLLLLGIYMKNCTEWVLAEHATYTLGGATVPFYDTLGPSTVRFILEQTNLTCVVCTRSELPRVCQAKMEDDGTACPKLKHVILVDGMIPELEGLVSDSNLNVISWSKVESTGTRELSYNRSSSSSSSQQQHNHHHRPPSGGDIATFCYTSGTTGNPKGALITHQNLVSTIASMPVLLNSSDRHLSYLPLPHIFERFVMVAVLVRGASISFFRGDPLLLIEDIQACRPTLLPVAPRVLNKIHDKVQAGFASAGGLKKKLFDRALSTKHHNLIHHSTLTHPLYDRLIFNKIKTALGLDCIRIMISGSAPLAPNVMIFFRCLLGVPVLEGYGQTEGTAAGTASLPEDVNSVGHVGGPVRCCEICLVDVPEMGYLSSDTVHGDGRVCRGRGEIWLRGPNVFRGYYKDEVKTRETIDEEGWLKSGDIGMWTMNGQLVIIDRKKNIFKLAQGEYVAAEKIENILIRSSFINQCFVYGDSFQSCLVAIVIPDEEVVVQKWATSSSSSTTTDFATLCKSDTRLKSEILSDIRRLSKEDGLHGFETVKAIFLDHEPFTADNGLVTPTFKLKRQQLRQRYQGEIDALYSSLPPPPSKL